MTLDRRLALARARIDRLEAELTAVYEKPLRAAARGIGARFRARAVTAAVQPRWTPPDPEDLIDGQQIAAAAQPEAEQIHERALRIVGAAAIGVSFDVANPFAVGLLDGLTRRSTEILTSFGDDLQAVIRDAHEQGLSVIDAAKLVQQRALDASTVTARLLARTDLNSIANGGSLLAAQLVDDASAAAGESGVGGKTWVTAGDERVRADHADADGQTVPLDQPFDVGGEQLLYPGDPQGSLDQIANCRCVVTYGGGLAAAAAPTGGLQSPGTMDEAPQVTALRLYDFHLTAAAGEPTRWQATLLVEDEPTEDGRMIAGGAATWRPLPLPLALMVDSGHADAADAPVCGRIDQIWRAGELVQAAGVFDSSDIGVEAERLVTERMITGVSVDGVCTASEVVVTRRNDTGDDQQLEDEVDQVVGGDPVVDETYEDDLEYLFVATEYVIMGATICPAGAIAQARIDVMAASGEAESETWKITVPFEPSRCEIAPTPRPDLAVEKLAAITASVDAVAERAGALEREFASRFESLTAAQVALFDSIDARLVKIAKQTDEIAGLRALAEQKPRRVQLERDADGRLAGLVEER